MGGADKRGRGRGVTKVRGGGADKRGRGRG